MDYTASIQLILGELDLALNKVDEEKVGMLIEDILGAEKVFLTGVGRVMLSLQAFAKRLNHLGIDAHCVGDITEPAMTPRDILIVASGSGCSIVPVAIAKKAKELQGKIIHIGSNQNGDVAEYADYMVRIPVRTRLYLEDEIPSEQPMTSLFEQSLLLFCDAVALMIIDNRKLNIKDYWRAHANLE